MAAMSNRARRMVDRHQRHKKGGGLNLVSLMDIFTILVFFLLVNSSEVETLPSSKGIVMPESIARMQPRKTVVVKITPEQILVEGTPVLSVSDALNTEATVLIPLRNALAAQRRDGKESYQDEVTIMGDRGLSYRVLKKVMSTCATADFERVSLAVMQRAAEAVET